VEETTRLRKVAIADDSPAFLAAAANYVASLPGFMLAGIASTAPQTLALVESATPDVLLLDLGISVAFTGVLPWREMIKPGTVIYDAVGSFFMERVAGFWAGQWLTVMVLVTAFASVYSMMLGYSRIPFAAAIDGTFFRYFGKTHPTKDFPHRSLLLVGILSAIASLFDLVQIITALVLARILIMFVGQIIGLLVFRKRHPEASRPFRMWLYPLPALFAMACWLYIFVVQAFQPQGWQYMLYVLAVFVSGVGLFLLLARKQRYWPFKAV